MSQPEHAEHIEAVRRFNRFYTRQLGLLQESLLSTPFNLSEARVLHELANREAPTATELALDLNLDTGYLSKILRRFSKLGLISKHTAEEDRRRSLLTLTEGGRAEFEKLRSATVASVEEMLDGLSVVDRGRLVGSMRTIESLLEQSTTTTPYILRPPHSGDIGWVVHRHGVIYNQEYGWDERFEALVAEIAASFVTNFDAKRERCWIAERHHENVGSVFVVSHPERPGVARLRLLLVEPSARGLGIGRRLIQECIRFARQAGYTRMTLWTNSVLTAASRLYRAEGFQLVHEEAHHSYGHDLVGQTWELDL